MNRPGAVPAHGQPGLRGLPGHMFAQTQQQPTGNLRGGGGAGGRLQNGGKLGNASNWAFGGAIGGGLGGSMGGGLGGNNPGSRGMSSFAQTIGGGTTHGQGALDMSDFPSLGGAPQNPQASAAQLWSNNATIRAGPNPPVQRPGGQQTMQNMASQAGNAQSNQQPQQHPSQNQGHEDGSQSTNAGFPSGTSADDFRFGTAGMQQALGNTEDFPPLGGLGATGTDLGGQDNAGLRGSSLMQGNAFGASLANGNALNRGIGSAIGDRGSAVSPNPAASEERLAGPRINRTITNPTAQHGQPLGFRNNTFQDTQTQQQPPIGRPTIITQQSSQQLSQPLNDSQANSPNTAQRSRQERLKDMSEMDRFGMKGLMVQLQREHPDYNPLIQGVDLTTLGLDLNRPDNSPIHPTFHAFADPAFPPANPNSRPGNLIPAFHIPQAYKNIQVPPIHTKMSSFSDETLFNIFYGSPRDMSQELAARELYGREWRWHTKLQQWLQKDQAAVSFPLSNNGFGAEGPNGPSQTERGWYIFFDVNNWRRERREFVLDLADLDQRHAYAGGGGAFGGTVGGARGYM